MLWRFNALFQRSLFLIGMCCAVPLQGALAQVEFRDPHFPVEEDWDTYGPYVDPEGLPDAAISVVQKTSGGNPGRYMELTLTRATVAQGTVATWAALINHTLVYNPGDEDSAPIAGLDFSIHNRVPAGTGQRTVSLAVEQGGFVWMALNQRKFLGEENWDLLEINDLVEENFVPLPGSEFEIDEQPGHPDFSTAGAPIAFGLGTGLSCPSSSNCATIVPRSLDLDNFLVKVKPLVLNAGVSDAWFYPATAGQGFFIVVFPVIKQLFMAWFTYDTERPGEEVTANLGGPGQRWLTAQGPFEGNRASLNIVLTTDGVFDSAEDKVNNSFIGTIEIEFADCESGTLSYHVDPLGLGGEVPIQRITQDNVALCKALSQ